MGRLHDGSGNSHRGAVAPFLDHRPHIVITPRMYIAAAMLSGIQACVNNVDTRMNPRVIQFDNTHFGDLRFSGARPETFPNSFVDTRTSQSNAAVEAG